MRSSKALKGLRMAKEEELDLCTFIPTSEPTGRDEVAKGAVIKATITMSPVPPVTWDDWRLINSFDAGIHETLANDFAKAAAIHPKPEIAQDMSTIARVFRQLAGNLRCENDYFDGDALYAATER